MQVEPASKKQRVERAPIVKQWEEIVAQISGGSDEVGQLTLVPCMSGILTVGAKVQQWGQQLEVEEMFFNAQKNTAIIALRDLEDPLTTVKMPAYKSRLVEPDYRRNDKHDAVPNSDFNAMFILLCSLKNAIGTASRK